SLCSLVGRWGWCWRRCGGELDGAQPTPPVGIQCQVVGLNDGRLKRIAGSETHVALALGALLPGGNRHAGFALQLALHALRVARRSEGELNVAARHRWVRSPEAIDVGGAERQDALAREPPLGDLGGELEAARAFVDGVDVFDAGHKARGVVVAQVFADTGEGVAHRYTERVQVGRWPDPGQQEELRGIVGASAQDYLAL